MHKDNKQESNLAIWDRVYRSTVYESPPIDVDGALSIRILALELNSKPETEFYHIFFRTKPSEIWRWGTMKYVKGAAWNILENNATASIHIVLGSSNEVFRLALNQDEIQEKQRSDSRIEKAIPHWPLLLKEKLKQRKISGNGTIVFDANWFLFQLATSTIDKPLFFPDATTKLNLKNLEFASSVAEATTLKNSFHQHHSKEAFSKFLLKALYPPKAPQNDMFWDGEGRLIGKYVTGELVQIGTDIIDGCEKVLGTGLLNVVFKCDEPLGIGLGPLQPNMEWNDTTEDSIGMGAEVGEVEIDGAASRAGVMEGMVFSQLSDPDLLLASNGEPIVSFEQVLSELDTRQANDEFLSITFDTAAPVSHLYAVEMPAAEALSAFAAAENIDNDKIRFDVDAVASLNTLCGSTFLWREETVRLFIGDAGSHTCAHIDICPKLEMAHGLDGIKIIGVSSPEATPRLHIQHAANDEGSDFGATYIPTDRPPTQKEKQLLSETDISLVLLEKGDVVVFDSGALHFASNGADGLNWTVYHGFITQPSIPRLHKAAQIPHKDIDCEGSYRNHLFAIDLLRIVAPHLVI